MASTRFGIAKLSFRLAQDSRRYLFYLLSTTSVRSIQPVYCAALLIVNRISRDTKALLVLDALNHDLATFQVTAKYIGETQL